MWPISSDERKLARELPIAYPDVLVAKNEHTANTLRRLAELGGCAEVLEPRVGHGAWLGNPAVIAHLASQANNN